MSIAPWSFSRLKSSEQCPKQFYHMKIAKDYSEPETDAMRYGTEAHLAAEEFIRDGKPNTPNTCLLYTSPSPRDGLLSRMPSSA